MLKFKGIGLNWSEIIDVSRNAIGSVLVTTTDNQVIEVGQYDSQAQAFAVYVLIQSAREAYSIGGIVIIIDIDDL